MRNYTYLLLLSFALVLSSCASVKKTSTTVDVNAVVSQYPTVADLEVLNKVEAEEVWNFHPFHIAEPKVSVMKSNLIANILKSKNADVLLEPQITYSKTSFGERVLTISGYPAKFKNFRKATKDDLDALKVNIPSTEKKIYNVSQSFWSKLWKRNK